ncbi:hypothetical protein BCR41DRAFT_394996 [Lobosporangium transversale]|uniref:FZ domain-containing protein n=1 Tax=Lobosporangium transversale TaxID=64571 RepID=A0A1Y2GR01_9FUNG|nr:hypothetical protein BCR41DRAFT_394996 [Lobosporangium transversale]ORZ19965.1 hypothetical protein BCR41DRAFT_394996 [Lobosporangium transversale]|eukprot:XP_021882505.1 hypothetical protein BCR41DRAFT_394996 [Lobosporangium transversale]
MLPASCADPFMEYVCSTSFPRVEATNVPSNFNVRFACKSTCQAAVTGCSGLLTAAGKADQVPNCDVPIPGTTQFLPQGVFFQPDGECNVVKPLNGGNPPGGGTGGGNNHNNQTMTCVAPFIADTMEGPGGTTTNEQYCKMGCCLPCPAQYSLYRTGALETGFKITNTMRAVSMVLSFILMISYLFLPDKRSHPRGMLIFASVATCAWCSALIPICICTLSEFSLVARKYWLLHTFCWDSPSQSQAVPGSGRTGVDSETVSRSTLSAGAAAMISQRRHIKPETLLPHIAEFMTCLMKPGATHDGCVEGMAPHLPPYGLMIAAEFLVSAIAIRRLFLK